MLDDGRIVALCKGLPEYPWGRKLIPFNGAERSVANLRAELEETKRQLAESALREGTLREALRPFAAVGDMDFSAPFLREGTWLWKRSSNVRDEPGITATDCVNASKALATPTAGKPLVDAVRALVKEAQDLRNELHVFHGMDSADECRGLCRRMNEALDALEALWPRVKG